MGCVEQGRNPRGQGGRLREKVLAAALELLDELGDDQPLSLRAVARELGIATTSIYLHFADRDELVLAALQQAHDELLAAVALAEEAEDDPRRRLQVRVLVLGAWASEHPGLYKVLHESTLNQRADMGFKELLARGTTAAVQRCMDAGLAAPDDAATVALDLRVAVHGAVSMRVNQPNLPWPPLEGQIDRFLTKLVYQK
jgi:AcrR family transcriptional regulator